MTQHAGHSHDEVNLRGRKLIITIVLNLLITVAQIIGAIIANSMALLSDAFHNFSDTSSLLISYIANRLTKKKSTTQMTFGYKRAEIIAAFINSTFLLVVGIYIIYESVNRIFFSSEKLVDPVIVMILAGFSIVMNGLSVLIIVKDSKSNMNIRSAYLHLFTDMLSSIAVLVGGAAIYFFDLNIIDPILSIFIAVYLIVFGWKLVIQSLKVLMQFTPKGIDIEKIAGDLSKFDEIKNLHHAHAWQLNDDDIMFEAHVEFNKNLDISDACQVLERMRKHLIKNYDIHHTTFQPEYEVSCNKELINQSSREH